MASCHQKTQGWLLVRWALVRILDDMGLINVLLRRLRNRVGNGFPQTPFVCLQTQATRLHVQSLASLRYLHSGERTTVFELYPVAPEVKQIPVSVSMLFFIDAVEVSPSPPKSSLNKRLTLTRIYLTADTCHKKAAPVRFFTQGDNCV